MDSEDQYRGSRKHILDWVDSEAFVAGLNELLRGIATVSAEADRWMPRGKGDHKEARLDVLGKHWIADDVRRTLTNWWLVHKTGANTPNWDLLSTASIGGRRGLVLVEAKANCSEIKIAGKILARDATIRSRENHAQIRAAIKEARVGLDALVPGVRIDIDTHYQLSNRLAFAWKLASLGVPNVLMYFGFVGDLGIADAGEPFGSEEHWREVFNAHATSVVPSEIFDRSYRCNNAAMHVVVRARSVLSNSTPINSSFPRN